jgi:hypothetical protein
MKKYATLVNCILKAYKKIDYRPNPKVYFHLESKECNPLVALVLAKHGVETFIGLANIFNTTAVYKEIKKMFDWVWVEGFDDAFDNREIKSNWKSNALHADF